MRWTTLGVLAALVLAGCASNESPPAQEDPLDDLDLEVTKETGLIRGVVVDTAVRPVAGATVKVQGSDRVATTGEDGLFGFDKLEPGTYFVSASKLGFVTVQQSVTVEAGVERPPAVRLMLPSDPTSLPFFRDFQWDGYMKCGLSVIALCGVAGSTTGDDFLHVIELDQGNITYVQSEMQWRSTQAVSPNMWIFQEATGRGGCTFDNPQGPSPIIVNTTFGDYGKYGSRDCFTTLGNSTDLRYRVFTGSIDGTRPPINDGCYPSIPGVIGELCSGIGATVEQDFQVFTHIFWGYKPPVDWQFGRDGPPPSPGA